MIESYEIVNVFVRWNGNSSLCEHTPILNGKQTTRTKIKKSTSGYSWFYINLIFDIIRLRILFFSWMNVKWRKRLIAYLESKHTEIFWKTDFRLETNIDIYITYNNWWTKYISQNISFMTSYTEIEFKIIDKLVQNI